MNMEEEMWRKTDRQKDNNCRDGGSKYSVDDRKWGGGGVVALRWCCGLKCLGTQKI